MLCFCSSVPTNRLSWGNLFIASCSNVHTHTRTNAKMYTSTQCQTIQLAAIKSIGVITQRLLPHFLPVHYHNCNYGRATMMCNYGSLSLLCSDVMSEKTADWCWNDRELHSIILIKIETAGCWKGASSVRESRTESRVYPRGDLWVEVWNLHKHIS